MRKNTVSIFIGSGVFQLVGKNPKCNCPHADGKRIICKHIVATYFTILPGEAKKFYEEAMAYQEEEERRSEELADKVCHYVRHMKKAELQEALLPDIIAYYETEEGQREFREWKAKRDAESTEGKKGEKA